MVGEVGASLDDVGHGVAVAADGLAGLGVGVERLFVLDECSDVFDARVVALD